jgi:hypothetical protein
MPTTCNTSEIIETPVRILYAPVDTAEPADSVALGGAWPTGWVEVGLTNAPLAMTNTVTTNEIKAQQKIMTVKEVPTDRVVTGATELQQFTMENLFLAVGGTVTNTAAASGQVGKSELEYGQDFVLPERAVGFEGTNGYGKPIRVFFRKATAKANGDQSYDKENQLVIPIIWNVLDPCDGDKPVKVQTITADALP